MGFIVYVNKDILLKYFRGFHLPNDIQVICRIPDQKSEHFLSSVTDLLDRYLKTYQDFIIRGDFNESESSPAMDSLNEEKCENIIKKKS